MALFVLVSLIFVTFSIIVAFRSFQSSKAAGITGLVLMAAISGLLQICGALIYLIGAGAATNTTGIWEAVVSSSVSGWILVEIAILLWYIGPRSNASNKTPVVTTFWVLETALLFGLPGGLFAIFYVFIGEVFHFDMQDIVACAASLIGVATPFLVWFFRSRFRKPADDLAEVPLAPVAYKQVSAENDPGFTNSTKIMLVVLAIAIVIMVISVVMNN